MLLLDTNVWSHLILSDEPKRAKVQAGLDALLLKYPGAARATSHVCIAECLVAARRLLDPVERAAAETAFQAEFASPNLMVVEIGETVWDKAASLRAEALRRAAAAGGPQAGVDGGKLKLPDAVVAASCLDFDPPAILVTENDSDFRFVDQTGQNQTVAGLKVERVG
ncbi:MAG: PIN domain-containing protein [Rhodoferax sp.]